MNNIVIVLTGIHGSGKTFLGNKLQLSGIPFFSEIGKDLRNKSSDSVNVPQEEFDSKVLECELERDKQILENHEVLSIETWHIGNLAFAKTRESKSVVERYETQLRKYLTQYTILIVKLEIDDETFINRASEKGITPIIALEFYRKLEKELDNVLNDVQEMTNITLWHRDMKSVDELVSEIKDWCDSQSFIHEREEVQ